MSLIFNCNLLPGDDFKGDTWWWIFLMLLTQHSEYSIDWNSLGKLKILFLKIPCQRTLKHINFLVDSLTIWRGNIQQKEKFQQTIETNLFASTGCRSNNSQKHSNFEDVLMTSSTLILEFNLNSPIFQSTIIWKYIYIYIYIYKYIYMYMCMHIYYMYYIYICNNVGWCSGYNGR